MAETGVDGLGQMKPMAEILRPNVAVVTLVALEHKSAFRTIDAIMAEKAELVAGVQPGGFALLNADDDRVMEMRHRTNERIVTFGQSDNADYRVEGISAAFPKRLSLTLRWTDRSLRLQTNFAGEHFWLPTAAAAVAALELRVSPEIVAERVGTFKPMFTRCGILEIPNGPVFIIDSTKAPWHSLPLAFNIVSTADAAPKTDCARTHIRFRREQ